jgi:hypothetical protein
LRAPTAVQPTWSHKTNEREHGDERWVNGWAQARGQWRISGIPVARVPKDENLQWHDRTLDGYLTRRLVQVGASNVFDVSHDFNMMLLDKRIAVLSLRFVGCYNKLNVEYAANE